MTHNISKIQLYIACGFGDSKDLGFHISIFHAKTIRTVWQCCVEVVVFFTTNPKKLSLHFSDFSTIFYEF
jgi:hypothetical protein